MGSNYLWWIIFIIIVVVVIIYIACQNNHDDENKVFPIKANSKHKTSSGGCPYAHGKRAKGSSNDSCKRGSLSHYSHGDYHFDHMFSKSRDYPDDKHLGKLSETMFKEVTDDDHNHKIEAGQTFLGQFVAHDITLNITDGFDGSLNEQNVRTPYLELDSLYGRGAADNPYLYKGAKLVHEEDDLTRSKSDVAIIGDPRNDENLIIAQLQLLFIKFHNKIVDNSGSEDPEEVRKQVVHNYQYIVVNDFLRKWCGDEVVDHVLKHGNKYYKPWKNKKFFMPHEFAAAAFRFGHGTLLNEYQINDNKVMGFDDLFKLRKGQNLDWQYFFGEYAHPSKKIEPFMAPALGELPGDAPSGIPKNSLPLRNLMRGKQLQLSHGQWVSKKMGIKPLSDKELLHYNPNLKYGNMHKKTPLWYYCLAESAIREHGSKLGPVAARIVCEVIIGLIQYDTCSYMNYKRYKPLVKNMDELVKYTLH